MRYNAHTDRSSLVGNKCQAPLFERAKLESDSRNCCGIASGGSRSGRLLKLQPGLASALNPEPETAGLTPNSARQGLSTSALHGSRRTPRRQQSFDFGYPLSPLPGCTPPASRLRAAFKLRCPTFGVIIVISSSLKVQSPNSLNMHALSITWPGLAKGGCPRWVCPVAGFC